MKVKIDTKEKMHVITIREAALAANMTEQMDKVITGLLEENVKNVVLNMEDTQMIDSAAASSLLKIQHLFHQRRASFVVCCLPMALRRQLAATGLLSQLNTAPTESEAIDMVQMEELERELGL